MKMNSKIIKVLVVIALILIIFNFLTLTHLMYTRISLNYQNDLLDSYNLNIFFVFVIAILASYMLKSKVIKVLSFAGAAASFVCLVIFTVIPSVRMIL